MISITGKSAAIPVMALLLLGLSACGGVGGGLVAGNISADGQTISFKIANDSVRQGDIVMWIEQEGRVFCETLTDVQPNSSYNIRLHCPAVRNGTFFVHADWAESSRRRALVANRI